jgi:ABC-type phosphate transport system substrate-binding protein
MKRGSLIKLGVVGLALTVTPIIGAGAAFADYAPQPGDIVGVGGDTPQYGVDFVLNGDTNGDAGYDGVATVNRVISFYATPDANGRSAYTNNVTTGVSSTGLNPTDVLRAGTYPVQRVSSSGSAITAFLADTGKEINFVSSASEPTAAQQNTAGSTTGLNWGYLHVVQIASDSVQIAANNTTNAPSGLSAAELLKIYTGAYTTWNQLPGNSAGSTDTIIPELPASTSSIYKTFVADLKTANGGTAPTLSSSIKTVEQNDPSAITSASTPADAIVPFSAGRLALWNSGYFHNPATAFPGGAVLTPGVKLLSGTPPDAAAVYNSPIADYIIFRQSDVSTAPAIQPGSTLNWIQYLFSNPGGTWVPFFNQGAGKALLAAAGLTPAYNDLGDVSNG